MLGLSQQTLTALAKLRGDKQIARQITVGVAALQYRGKVDNLVHLVETTTVRGMRDFFEETTSLLADTADLYSQIGGRFGSKGWKPLSASWVKRKGHAAFFAYTSANAGLARRRRRRAQLLGEKASTPLLTELRKVNTERAFGRAKVERKWMTVELRGASAHEVITDLQLSVNLFPGLPGTGLAKATSWVRGRAVISSSSATKLIGKPAWHRPVLVPMMAFYSQVRIPRLIVDALRKGSTRTAQVTQSDARFP